MIDESEQLLVRRILAGDREAYAELIRAHHVEVYRLLVRLCRDAHLAEDLTQEAFAAAWAGMAKFGGKSSLRTWLHRIAYRKYLDVRRRRSVCAVASPDNAADPVDARSPDPVGLASEEDERRQLHAALDLLQGPDRDALVLHYLQGLTYEQMSEVTSVPAGTIKWRTSQALARLRRVLEGKAEYEIERAAE